MIERLTFSNEGLTGYFPWHPRARQLAAWLRLWHRRHLTRQQLSRLDGDRLADLGLSDAARVTECRKWFWQK